MEFHDKRPDPTQPVPAGLERLRAALVAQAKGNLTIHKHVNGLHISLAAHDPKTGLSVSHLQLNYEPDWIDDEFKAEWQRLYGTHIRSELLENQDWKRYAWGVWEE